MENPERLSHLSKSDRQQLCQAARTVAERSYSPYSHFRVGAAVRTVGGIFVGTNVENASFGLSLCAERAAITAAVAAGERKFQALAISCIDADAALGLPALMPCGACRQWLVELADDAAEIVICKSTIGSNTCETHIVSVADLLPQAFRLS